MFQHTLDQFNRICLVVLCVFAVAAGSGCNATRRGLCRLDNICRNRCNCSDVVSSGPPTAVEYVTAPSNVEVTQAVETPDSQYQAEIVKLTEKLKEANHERELAVKEAMAATIRSNDLSAEVQQVQAERDQLQSRTQILTDHLLTSQQNLMRVERGFSEVQTEHERTVMKLETRLTQILDRCNSDTLK
ncbi:hypothetical protein ACFL2H_06340 [Planctomycetota bacterium]